MSLNLNKWVLGVFFILSSTSLLASGEGQDMLGLDDEDSANSTSKLKKQKEKETKGQGEDKSAIQLEIPDATLLHLFSVFDIVELGIISQVSKQWNQVASSPTLWKEFGLSKYKGFLTKEDLKTNPKKVVILHRLSMLANAAGDLNNQNRLVTKYSLLPYKHKQYEGLNVVTPVLKKLVQNDMYREELMILGYSVVVEELLEGGRNEAKNLKEFRPFNDALIERGNQEAIQRKIEGLWHGGETYTYKQTVGYDYANGPYDNYGRLQYGYLKYPQYHTRTYPTYGYDKNPQAARELNETLVEKEDPEAIARKLEGLVEGKYGYDKNPQAARELNEALVEKEDPGALHRRLEGLYKGRYGYEKDFQNEQDLFKALLKQGKTNVNFSVLSVYEQNKQKQREFIEEDLISCEHAYVQALGHYLKVLGLKYGEFGYESNRFLAIEYINKHEVPF